MKKIGYFYINVWSELDSLDGLGDTVMSCVIFERSGACCDYCLG